IWTAARNRRFQFLFRPVVPQKKEIESGDSSPQSKALGADAVAAFVLRLIQLLVGAANEVARRDGGFADRRRYPGADSDVVAAIFVLKRRLVHELDEALGDGARAFAIGFG